MLQRDTIVGIGATGEVIYNMHLSEQMYPQTATRIDLSYHLTSAVGSCPTATAPPLLASHTVGSSAPTCYSALIV